MKSRHEKDPEDWTDEEILAAWKAGQLIVMPKKNLVFGNLCVCPEKMDGEWCDKCEGYAVEWG